MTLEVIRTECPKCGRVVADVQGVVVVGRDTVIEERYSLSACQGCGAPLLTCQDRWEDSAPGDVVRLYPPFDRTDQAVPERVRRTLDEAKGCLRHGFHTAAVVMCRRVIEVASSELDPSVTGVLASRIAALAAAGKLTKQLADWANVLRDDGNFAAHDPDAVFDREHAQDLVAFAEAFTTFAFVLDARFQEFQKRRAARKAATP